MQWSVQLLVTTMHGNFCQLHSTSKVKNTMLVSVHPTNSWATACSLVFNSIYMDDIILHTGESVQHRMRTTHGLKQISVSYIPPREVKDTMLGAFIVQRAGQQPVLWYSIASTLMTSYWRTCASTSENDART